ncbi:hypothetical protein HYH03_004428 [Edaphochlamys debaryana]|uniref:Uncharacterized protein n=1 Tax=Edaphochlamys debaryana TaxID=47281 RepID=A0A835YBB8_9CHLO|nr:hypothetical protein HYH03_004428 [Edaphochlamys debaryana]|eukprot:KAG2497691.1 hypothetical protein HYH03_004428 [Edaphochlamys debaryana]
MPSAVRIARTAGGKAFLRPGAAAALASALRSAGLTATQLTTPTVLAPSPSGGAPTPCTCRNVHTLVRGRRAAGLEALALVTPVAFGPQRPDSALDGRNQAAEGAKLGLTVGAALALHLGGLGPGLDSPESGSSHGGWVDHEALAAAANGGRWLARDLLWVVPDLACGVSKCLEAWVEDYHHGGQAGSGAKAARRRAGEQRGAEEGADGFVSVRGGVVQQAVVLEALYGAAQYDTLELLALGRGGLLPKQDMLALLKQLAAYPGPLALWRDDVLPAHPAAKRAVQLAERAGAALGVKKEVASDYAWRLLSALQFAWHCAVGRPSGAHAAFTNVMTDAAGLRTVQRGHGLAPWQLTQYGGASGALENRGAALAASLELCLRSLNNLAERMHHSPPLYVLTWPGGAGLADASGGWGQGWSSGAGGQGWRRGGEVLQWVSVERYVAAPVALALAVQLQAAWSMARVRSGLASSAASPAAGGGVSAGALWATAAARAAGRARTLAILSAGLHWVVCGGGAAKVLPSGLAAALDRVLEMPLDAPGGVLAAAAALAAVFLAATAAAGIAGRLAGRAFSRGSSNGGGGDGSKGAEAQPASKTATAAGSGAGSSAARTGPVAEAAPSGSAAAAADLDLDLAWHAERVLVLTATAVVLAAAVCLNWAAAAVAGSYLAMLALAQGVGAGFGPTLGGSGGSGCGAGVGGAAGGGRRRGRGIVGKGLRALAGALWLGACPAIKLWGAAGVWAGGLGSVAGGVCGPAGEGVAAWLVMAATGFWLWGLEAWSKGGWW